MTADFTPDEMMTIAAARMLTSQDVCFVGIGPPSAACNMARLTHAPGITLIYESGTIGTAPNVLPLSIGDGELCDTALTTVSVPEMFRYWLQGGHITVGFLGAAQIDRFGNINTTVIGDYASPRTRLPGGGGAPEIASLSQKVFVTMKQSHRAMVDKIDFVTSFGHGQGAGDRAAMGLTTAGPAALITDLAVWEPDPDTGELTVTTLHAGTSRAAVAESCGWPARFASGLVELPPPTAEELSVLRALKERTEKAHARTVEPAPEPNDGIASPVR